MEFEPSALVSVHNAFGLQKTFGDKMRLETHNDTLGIAFSYVYSPAFDSFSIVWEIYKYPCAVVCKALHLFLHCSLPLWALWGQKCVFISIWVPSGCDVNGGQVRCDAVVENSHRWDPSLNFVRADIW